MKFKIDHDFHIHSQLSLCSSDPEQNPESILKYAEENGITTLCLTDHYWDSTVEGASEWYEKQGFDHIKQSLPLPQGKNTRFLFGCETEMDKFFTVGIPKERFDDFDFIVIPTTHMHMVGFTIPTEAEFDLEMKAKLWVTRLDKLLDLDLPFEKVGIAHLNCSLIHNHDRNDFLKTMNMIPDSEMGRVFEKASRLGCGIELNMYYSPDEEDTVLRPFKIAKECGCKFYYASDAHHPDGFKKKLDFAHRFIDYLGLEEKDKFIIG